MDMNGFSGEGKTGAMREVVLDAARAALILLSVAVMLFSATLAHAAGTITRPSGTMQQTRYGLYDVHSPPGFATPQEACEEFVAAIQRPEVPATVELRFVDRANCLIFRL